MSAIPESRARAAGAASAGRFRLPVLLRPTWSELATPAPERRRLRDTLVDLLLIAPVGLLGLTGHVEAVGVGDFGRPFLAANLVALVIAVCVVPLRRRRPELLAAITVPLSSIFIGACALPLLAAFTVGARLRPNRALAWIAALSIPVWINSLIFTSSGTGMYLSDVALGTAVTIAVGAWGLYVGTRRQLLVTLRERAERAEAEQQLRVTQARHQERTRIAREMHDVLAHRMSLLSVHAGALEYRSDAPADDVARAASVIRTTAHEALEELRAVIGVLRVEDLTREVGDAATPEAPQPTLRDVPALVDSWREAGARVDLTLPQETADIPVALGRTAYRVVQEGLTNAGKHAPGARVQVVVTATEDGDVKVEVENALPVGEAGAVIPGTGVGLVGLHERTELIGGRLLAGPRDGRFRLCAELPKAPG